MALVAFALLVALAWERLSFAIAVASSEDRPALLTDAKWGKPAFAFHQRFSDGTSEAALIQWLASNDFEIDRRAHQASRTIHSVPCNERVAVSWSEASGLLRESRAVVYEAGCL